jgi:cbb3-type cytochrome oxidase subunit 1
MEQLGNLYRPAMEKIGQLSMIADIWVKSATKIKEGLIWKNVRNDDEIIKNSIDTVMNLLPEIQASLLE